MDQTIKVLLVEDNPGDARLLQVALEDVDSDIQESGAGSLVYWAMVTFIRSPRGASKFKPREDA